MKDVMGDTTSWREILNGPAAGQHIGQVYRNKEQFALTVSHFIAQGLRRDEAVLVMARPAQWSALVARLATSPEVDLVDAVMKGQLRTIDADVNLSICMRGDVPQWECFQESIVIVQSRKRFGTVRIYSEMTDILWHNRKRDAAVRLEEFWNELMRGHAFSLLCAFHADDADRNAYNAAFNCVCKAHTHLLPHLGEGPSNTGAHAPAGIDSPPTSKRPETA